MKRSICKTFGYVWVSIRNHPGFPGVTYVKEHHLVWWENTGQRVPKGFILHHKDHDKTNNDISNLQLMSRSEHLKEHDPNQFIDVTVRQRISDRAKARCTPEWREAVSARVKEQYAQGKFGVATHKRFAQQAPSK